MLIQCTSFANNANSINALLFKVIHPMSGLSNMYLKQGVPEYEPCHEKPVFEVSDQVRHKPDYTATLDG